MCTVVINSTTPAVYTASGSVTATINVSVPDGIGGTVSTPVVRTRATGDAKNTAAGGTGSATKTYVDLRIQIGPSSATNAVGVSHTFVVTVEQNTGSGWSGVAGVNPVISYVGTAPTTAPTSCVAVTLANGTCTVTINNSTAGLFTANASITHSVSGQSITRTTGTAANTTAGGSGNATKTYVDLRISIDPLTDTNAVNVSHTFTVKVEQKIGAGTWTAVAGVSPAVTVSPAPSSITNSCDGAPAADVTNASGDCTVVINSTTATVYTANASVTVSVSGQSITRNTDSTAGSAFTANNTALAQSPARTGTATKTYVGLRISLSPQSATNAVNDPHTFTVKVEQKIGNGAWTPLAGVSPAVTVSPAPSSITNSCDGSPAADVTNASGDCTVVINSTTAAVYTANASITATVSGQSITRSTDSTAGSAFTENSAALAQAPARTGTATKTYVDLRISLSPLSDTNAVNVSHTFTVKVEQNTGSGWTAVAGVSPAVTVSPAPSSITNSCDGSPAADVTNASGDCTVVINSTTAAVYTANASITVTVSGQSITRNTDSTAGSAFTENNTALAQSPARTGTATKTYVNLRISLSPLTDTNAVNDPHTFTVKVEQQIGTGAWTVVVGVFPVVSVTPTPSSITNNCAASPTNASGECTVVINSTTATTYTANASLTTTVSGQSITRNTTGDAANLAASGSGPATKIYKAGSIGDFLWWDIDKDGRQDAGEPGINGVTVNIFPNANCTGAPSQTTTTANGGSPATDGFYQFGGLGAGTFCLEILSTEFDANGTLENWIGSPKDAASVPDTLDSDADVTTHRITSIVIEPVAGTQNDTTRDFGFFKNSGHTLTKARVTDPTSTGVRVNEPISFTITVVNTGTTWLSAIPISDTFDTNYIQFLSANIGGVNTSPDITVTNGLTVTKQWNDITGAGVLAPGATIQLVVFYVGVGDTTVLPVQAPCTGTGNTCNRVSTTSASGTGPTVDPDGPSGPLTPLEVLPPKTSQAPVKVVNPTAVALADYGAVIDPSNVTLRWTTVNESAISGFAVYRSDSSGVSVYIASLSAQKPGQADGASYSLTDNSAVYGVSYTYLLEVQMFSGGKETMTLANTSFLWLPMAVR